MKEVYESGNRRAEVSDGVVKFLRMTGKVRRSVIGVWPETVCEDITHARRLAKRWTFKGLLGSPVLN